jgi:hypothetical protein
MRAKYLKNGNCSWHGGSLLSGYCNCGMCFYIFISNNKLHSVNGMHHECHNCVVCSGIDLIWGVC